MVGDRRMEEVVNFGGGHGGGVAAAGGVESRLLRCFVGDGE